uniref:Uncharacterized protein n=1 Tax=Candidatus Kentrum eta TaxID=2126337 RepID=A0A450VCE5_9GAMM|nr:MAG: hypothetical protein BECKH772B_GA0070898_102762 [Candidatus Kentron sp. H]VFK02434.1 MAG: hypothetical protein BECKH772A_GA0070896_102692 [Candidatus Kentron sp. H]VFK05435.1 MAG: hypothetical protein BECKH772C_GA0070978_102712 [Candidatus Kentron sp. H]
MGRFFIKADQELLGIAESHGIQQKTDRTAYRQRRQLLQERMHGLQASRAAWAELGKQIASERDRLQLGGNDTNGGAIGDATTAQLDAHSTALQQAIVETPFTVVVKFDATRQNIPVLVDEAGRHRVTVQLESMLDALLGPDALAIAKKAEFTRQKLTPVALIAVNSGFRGLAKLTYRLTGMDPLPPCGDRGFLQRIGLIKMGATPEGYATFSDFRTQQEWLLVGMGDKGYGFSMDDVDVFIDQRSGGWRLPKVEEIDALRNSDLYQFMQRDIKAVNKPFWTGSVRNAEQRGFCFSSYRHRRRVCTERATEFADGENLAMLLLRATTEGERP